MPKQESGADPEGVDSATPSGSGNSLVPVPSIGFTCGYSPASPSGRIKSFRWRATKGYGGAIFPIRGGSTLVSIKFAKFANLGHDVAPFLIVPLMVAGACQGLCLRHHGVITIHRQYYLSNDRRYFSCEAASLSKLRSGLFDRSPQSGHGHVVHGEPAVGKHHPTIKNSRPRRSVVSSKGGAGPRPYGA